MTLILNIILFIVAVAIFVGFGIKINNENYNTKVSFNLNKKQLFSILPILIAIALMCVAVIPANTVGVRYSAFTGTSEKTLSEGIHFKIPFDKVYEIDTTVQERTVKDINVQTKDAQFVKMEINIKYQVSNDNAFKVYKGYKTLDNLNTNIIANYSQTALNTICTQYNVIDVLGEDRNEFENKTVEILTKSLSSEGVTLKALTIKNMDAGDEIEKAIKAEAVAKKDVETAEQNRLKASKDAETKLIQAEGEAKANEVKTRQLTKEILMEQFISKWNGELPKVSSDGSNMFDISSLIK